jgi:hypothetical protein
MRRALNHPLCLLLLAALLVRGGVLLAPGALAADPDGYLRLAESLVSYGTLGSSLRPLAGEGPGVSAVRAGPAPSAYRPPLYPLLLTPCVLCGAGHGSHHREVRPGVGISGQSPSGDLPSGPLIPDPGLTPLCLRLAIGILHVGLGLATVWLVYVLGRRWGLGNRTAALAGLLVACDPILLAQSTQVMTETPAALLAVVGLLALTRACNCPSGSAGRATLAGGALALGVLCRPEFLLFLAAAGVAVAIGRWRTGADGTRSVPAAGRAGCWCSAAVLLAFAVGAAIVLAPWAIRNQVQFGRPIVTTTHGGYTLWLANNPDFYQWLHSGPWGDAWRSDRLDAQWRTRRPSDELEADRLAYQRAWATIRQQPVTFAYACLVRLGRLWSPLPHRLAPDESAARRWSRWAVAVWYVAEFLLAALGVWRIRRRAAWGLLLVGCVTAVHTVYWTDMRMRGPLMAVVAIAAAVGACGIEE